jgi:hypothetical protein
MDNLLLLPCIFEPDAVIHPQIEEPGSVIFAADWLPI